MVVFQKELDKFGKLKATIAAAKPSLTVVLMLPSASHSEATNASSKEVYIEKRTGNALLITGNCTKGSQGRAIGKLRDATCKKGPSEEMIVIIRQ